MSDTGALIPVGEKLKFYREASGRTKVGVAALAGISVDYLHAIEKGSRTPTVPVLYRLASVLRVRVAALLSEPDFEQADPASPWAGGLAAAMIEVSAPAADEPDPDLDALRDRLQSLHATWQQSPNRYSDTLPLLPDLVRDIIATTRMFRLPADAERRREAFRLASDLMLLVRPAAKYVSRPDIALMAGDRGVMYAELADDPVRAAIAKWNLAQSLSTNNEPERVENVALAAADELGPEMRREGAGQRDALATYGMLHMMAAIAEVRQTDWRGALARIRREAEPIARRLGETNSFWTLFGPSNVLAYQVTVQMEAGEGHDALRSADDLDLASLGSVERRASHLLAVARAYEQRGEDASVLLTLMRMEREAPEDLRYRGVGHALVAGLLHRARPSFAPDVRDLARRVRPLAPSV